MQRQRFITFLLVLAQTYYFGSFHTKIFALSFSLGNTRAINNHESRHHSQNNNNINDNKNNYKTTKTNTSITSHLKEEHCMDRRGALGVASSLFLTAASPIPTNAAEEVDEMKKYAYELRDRNKNKDAIIRDDIWYFTGQNPPRKLDLSNLPPGPKYNAWGSCATDSSTGNSCTYVSLKQKIPAYSKYAFTISLGAKDFIALGNDLRSTSQPSTASLLEYVEMGVDAKYLPPARDALLKMVLLATSLLTSPNYTGPPFELLIARYYINEVSFSMKEIADAVRVNDMKRAIAAWEFGADSWNSYFTILNNAIVPKVGDKFAMIE